MSDERDAKRAVGGTGTPLVSHGVSPSRTLSFPFPSASASLRSAPPPARKGDGTERKEGARGGMARTPRIHPAYRSYFLGSVVSGSVVWLLRRFLVTLVVTVPSSLLPSAPSVLRSSPHSLLPYRPEERGNRGNDEGRGVTR